MNKLRDIRAFIEVARTESFFRAGEALGQSGSSVSKAVRRLEDELGVRLLLRTTRQVSLSEDGREFMKVCERLIEELEAAGDAVSKRRGSAQGVLTVQLPLLWGREAIVPALPKFLRTYPRMQLRLVFGDHDFGPLTEGVDVCVRLGMPEVTGLIAKPLMVTRSVIVAAPAYLQRFGIPSSPEELNKHACIHYLQQGSTKPVHWHFTRAGRTSYRIFQSALMLNDPPTMREAALHGLGLVQGPDFLFAEALRRGRLIRVLEEWEGDGPSIYIVWAHNRYASQRQRVFIDWLVSLIK